MTVATPPDAPRRPVLLSEGKVALMPLGDRLRFGGTLELAGLDGSLSRPRVDGHRRTVRSYLPGLADRPRPSRRGAGSARARRTACRTSAGPQAYRNVSVACGHGHIGMGLAPVGGELIAQLLAGEPTGHWT